MTTRPAYEHDLASLRVRDYLDLLGSDAPAPGGGSAAALCASSAGALVEMVCGMNAKRASNADRAGSSERKAAAAHIRSELLELVTADARVYAKIAVEWKTKSPALESALAEGCKIPIRLAKLALEALKIARRENENTSAHLKSDIYEAALILAAAAGSSAFHVEGNTAALKNAAAAARLRAEIKATLVTINREMAALGLPERRV